MHVSPRSLVLAAAASLTMASPALAQGGGLMADLIRDAEQVEKKIVALAKAMPEDKLTWRPAAGVRSPAEVFLHLASDNYLLPVAVGVEPPASTGIKSSDFSTLATYERRPLGRDAIASEITTSFAHLFSAMRGFPEARLGESVKLFGQEMTIRQVWLLTVTHLHEHLGQAIAYARINDVVPPWSK